MFSVLFEVPPGPNQWDSYLGSAKMLRPEQRFDETESGEATTVAMIDSQRPKVWIEKASPEEVANWLGPPLLALFRGTCSMRY
jgi:hypothetical protein